MKTRLSLTSMLIAASVLLLLGQGLLIAQSPPRRLSADFQNNATVGGTGEIFTNLAAGAGGAGGKHVYSKTLQVACDVDVIYVSFSAQGDAHFGSALLMNAKVNGDLIQPLKGQTGSGGGGPHLQTGWYTQVILPTQPGDPTGAADGNNCDDGGGGSIDCHDNTIAFSGCSVLAKCPTPDSPPRAVTVDINLADLPGGGANIAWYERSTIYIDGQHDPQGALCQGAGVPSS